MLVLIFDGKAPMTAGDDGEERKKYHINNCIVLTTTGDLLSATPLLLGRNVPMEFILLGNNFRFRVSTRQKYIKIK